MTSRSRRFLASALAALAYAGTLADAAAEPVQPAKQRRSEPPGGGARKTPGGPPAGVRPGEVAPRPEDGCIDIDDPRAQSPDGDMRNLPTGVKLCCLDPADPRAHNIDDPRRVMYPVDVCGPDVRSVVAESFKRHALPEEVVDFEFVLLARDGSRQTLSGRMARTQSKAGDERVSYRFAAPADLAGLTLLTIETARGLDSWMYDPAFERLRTLGPRELKERFLDTDLAFADLRAGELAHFDYYFRRMEGTGPDEHYVFAAVPRTDSPDRNSPYGAWMVWLRKRDLVVTRVKGFDRMRHPWKEMLLEDIVEVAPGVERANKVTWMDMQRKHKTVLTFTHRVVNRGIDARWLDPATFHD